MIHDLPPIVVSGLFSLGAAGVSGVLTWFGGERSGKTKGRKEFINAVESAAALVITRLETLLDGAEARERLCLAQHQECTDTLAGMKLQITELMDSSVPGYEIGRITDG